ncbi:MAG: glycosyltransferase family 2 protein [Cyclobacteriaceae bacterium]
MKVSIITAVYNNVETISGCIESVINQDYSNIEYIIIDGKSDDGTIDKINTYSDHIDYLISDNDNGIYDAMNKGLAIATGEIVGFINSDDMLNSSNCISAIVAEFERTKADIVYGDKVYYSKDLKRMKRYWKAGPLKLESYRYGWMTPHLSTYIKKGVYDEYGFFNTSLKVAADYELMFRFIYCQRVKAVYLPKIIAKMREGGVSNGSLSKMWRTNYEVYKSWAMNDRFITPLIIILKPLSKITQLF